MKRFYIVRHAKSSWDNPGLDDFDRPLNKRGKRDAPFMGDVLYKRGVRPALIISSPAARAIATARVIAAAVDYPESTIREEIGIYEAGVPELLQLIRGIQELYHDVMLVGHNPGLTMLANYLGSMYYDNIPTTGVVALELNVQEWKTVTENCATALLFEYPKLYFRKDS